MDGWLAAGRVRGIFLSLLGCFGGSFHGDLGDFLFSSATPSPTVAARLSLLDVVISN